MWLDGNLIPGFAAAIVVAVFVWVIAQGLVWAASGHSPIISTPPQGKLMPPPDPGSVAGMVKSEFDGLLVLFAADEHQVEPEVIRHLVNQAATRVMGAINKHDAGVSKLVEFTRDKPRA